MSADIPLERLPPPGMRIPIAHYRDEIGRRFDLFAVRFRSGGVAFYLHRITDKEAELLGICDVADWLANHGIPDTEGLRQHAKRGNTEELARLWGARHGAPQKGMSWQEAMKRLLRKKSQGEKWTSYAKMAGQLGCSVATVSRAVGESEELQKWVGRQPVSRVQSLNETVIGRNHVTDKRESDPQDDAAEVELRKLFEAADPDEKAFLNSISGGPRDYLSWYIDQTARERQKHRKAYKSRVEFDATAKAWFLNTASLEQKLEYLNDTQRHQKSYHTS